MSKHKKLTDVEILKYDIVNENGRIYTKEIVLNIIKDFKDTKQPQLGEFNYGESAIVNLSRVSHETINLNINEDDKTLEGTFKTLDNSLGKKLLEILESGEVSVEPRVVAPLILKLK